MFRVLSSAESSPRGFQANHSLSPMGWLESRHSPPTAGHCISCLVALLCLSMEAFRAAGSHCARVLNLSSHTVNPDLGTRCHPPSPSRLKILSLFFLWVSVLVSGPSGVQRPHFSPSSVPPLLYFGLDTKSQRVSFSVAYHSAKRLFQTFL